MSPGWRWGRMRASTLRLLLTITELGMLAYWVATALSALGVVDIPPELLYSNASDPLIRAWNWSFLPLDLAFIGIGLAARIFGSLPRAVEDAGLVLMFCAGLMAIAFWSARCSFDPFWWAANVWLMGLAAVAFAARLSSGKDAPRRHDAG